MSTLRGRLGTAVRVAAVALAAAGAALAGWFLFYEIPTDAAQLLGVLLTLGLVLLVVKLAAGATARLTAAYNVAEVAVEGPITRDGGGGRFPASPGSTPADDVVEQIERAADDPRAEALLLRLNTPGGEVLPSDDIRRAAATFDGPAVAYATDTCASGGYWIASGCDELWAHDESVVGSIGVIGSRPNVSELAERLGVSYERFAAGRYKDAGLPLKELSDDERAYLQGIIDDFYDRFVERVAEGRGLDPEFVRETEARVYLGGEAAELGLVDSVGTRESVEERLSELVGADAVVEEFAPRRGVAERLGLGARRVAFAFGAGVASRLGPADAESFEFRLR